MESEDGTPKVEKVYSNGARALATRVCATPVQAYLQSISTKRTVVNCKSGAKNT